MNATKPAVTTQKKAADPIADELGDVIFADLKGKAEQFNQPLLVCCQVPAQTQQALRQLAKAIEPEIDSRAVGP